MKKLLAVCFLLILCAPSLASLSAKGLFPYQPPVAGPFLKITSSSITASWGTGTNDASTRYECENITTSTSLSPSTNVTSWESTGLIAETIYGFRARAWDDSATPPSATSWTDLGSATTASRILSQGTGISDNSQISSNPNLGFRIRNTGTINDAACVVYIDAVPVTDGTAPSGKYDTISSSSGISTLSYTPKSPIAKGSHNIKIEMADSSGTLFTETARNLTVYDPATTELKITSTPLCYPNPYNPLNGNMKIAYNLSVDGDITLYFVDAAGNVILKRSCISGSQGARYGYNEAPWDGKNGFGETVSNDIYLICIADGSGKILGKTRAMVLK